MRYVIWDKQAPVITPIGEVLTAEQWKQRHPIAGVDSIKVVLSAGEINGAFFGTLGQMVQMFESMGADFSKATTDREKLDVIEAFEDAQSHQVNTGESSAEERIASALETQIMLSMAVINDDDPDLD